MGHAGHDNNYRGHASQADTCQQELVALIPEVKPRVDSQRRCLPGAQSLHENQRRWTRRAETMIVTRLLLGLSAVEPRQECHGGPLVSSSILR